MATKKKATRSVSIRKKEEYNNAKDLFVHHGKEAKEIETLLGVRYNTILKWIKGDPTNAELPDLRKLRAAKRMSKSDQLTSLANQINEINTKIKSREEGNRHPDSKEADIISKLTKAYNALETELGVREIVDVSMELLPFIKKYSNEDADLFKNYTDKFIQHKVAKAK